MSNPSLQQISNQKLSIEEQNRILIRRRPAGVASSILMDYNLRLFGHIETTLCHGLGFNLFAYVDALVVLRL